MKHLNLLLLFTGFLFFAGCESEAHWYKGNLHTHSYWSDGDDYPEMIIDWYKQNGYDFIALSDHNILAAGEKWVNVTARGSGNEALQKYLEKFGEDWIVTRQQNDSVFVRLKTYAEYRDLFEETGSFLVIQSEEITDDFEGKPVHLNATNISELIPPQGGESVHHVMQNNIDAVLAQRRRTAIPMFPHINHPNFHYAITAEDIMTLRGEKFFEVYNGHPAVHNEGDATRPGTDRLWDIVLSYRLQNGLPVMYGLATDDAHSYHEMTTSKSNPGRGWVMVKTANLNRDSIISAMENGDFYASSGVVLNQITRSGNEIRISIRNEDGVQYKTEFIGTLTGTPLSVDMTDQVEKDKSKTYNQEVGKVLHTSGSQTASYSFTGNELYVRARITSSKLKTNPYREGEFETAWTQPIVP